MNWMGRSQKVGAFVDESIEWMVFNVLHLQSSAETHMSFFE